MPTISVFYGILIQMFWRDHAPPHFHALNAEDEAPIDIRTLELIQGSLPKRALALVLEWASEGRIDGGLGPVRTDADAKEDRTLEIAPQISPRAGWRVADVQALPGYKLRVRFNDGTEGEVDLSQLIQAPHAGVFAALRDETIYREVQLALGAVTWPGNLDLAPDAMYEAIRGEVSGS
jgi:hypothetical protein